MAGTWYQMKELGGRPEKVDDLRYTKEQQGLAEMPQYPHTGKGHAGEIAIGVADKDGSGVPVVLEQAQGNADETQECHDGKEVIVDGISVTTITVDVHF